jgi:hypothetical protein
MKAYGGVDVETHISFCKICDFNDSDYEEYRLL